MDEVPSQPYKEEQFEAFLKLLSEGHVSNWLIIAKALGVSQQTILLWKKHPKARDAIRQSVERAITEMEKVGQMDWKMWREKLKMLDVLDKQIVEHEAGEGVTELLDKLGLETDYGEFADQTAKLMANRPTTEK